MNSIPNEVTANVDPEGILKLDLSNNHIETIPKGSFEIFSKLEELELTNNGLSTIEEGAFDGLQQMLTLNLSNNNLLELKSELFKETYNLQILILSNNSLEYWENFQISDFLSLQYLDISNNRFTYLPLDLLNVLEEHPTFTLIADENPWNCENENLKNFNVGNFICGLQNASETITPDERINSEVGTVASSENGTIGYLNPATESPAANICIVRSYKRNLLPIWLTLAIVAGIIIGNIDRIYSWLSSKCKKQTSTRNISNDFHNKVYDFI